VLVTYVTVLVTYVTVLVTYVTVLVTYVTVSGWLPIYILITPPISRIKRHCTTRTYIHFILPRIQLLVQPYRRQRGGRPAAGYQ
jgi:hypothetical protein